MNNIIFLFQIEDTWIKISTIFHGINVGHVMRKEDLQL